MRTRTSGWCGRGGQATVPPIPIFESHRLLRLGDVSALGSSTTLLLLLHPLQFLQQLLRRLRLLLLLLVGLSCLATRADLALLNARAGRCHLFLRRRRFFLHNFVFDGATILIGRRWWLEPLVLRWWLSIGHVSPGNSCASGIGAWRQDDFLDSASRVVGSEDDVVELRSGQELLQHFL